MNHSDPEQVKNSDSAAPLSTHRCFITETDITDSIEGSVLQLAGLVNRTHSQTGQKSKRGGCIKRVQKHE